MLKNNNVRITRVVTRNVLMDLISSIQNIFGANLSFYEKMINKAMESIEEELTEKKVVMKWYRYEISQLTNGAMVIMFYGEQK